MTKSIDRRMLNAEWQRLVVLAASRIYDAMDASQLSQADLAKKMGVTESRVSQVLSGERNLTLKTLAQFGTACGVRWDVGLFVPSSGTIQVEPREKTVTAHWLFGYPMHREGPELPRTSQPIGRTFSTEHAFVRSVIEGMATYALPGKRSEPDVTLPLFKAPADTGSPTPSSFALSA
jgi:transcriptional regulator with XRE-family HTH domain